MEGMEIPSGMELMDGMPVFFPMHYEHTFNSSSDMEEELEKIYAIMNNPSGSSIHSGCHNHSTSSNRSHSTTTHPHRLYRIILDVCLVSLICLLGFFGNVLTIVILRSDKDKKSTTNWLLQSLAVIDIVYLIACIFIQPLKTISDVTDWLHPSFKHAFIHAGPYVWTLASMAQMITVWMLMLVTIDRYIAVCYPLKSGMRTLNRARLAGCLGALIAVLYNIPMLFEREVWYTNEESCRGPSWVPVSTYSSLRNSVWYFLIYKTICYFIFRPIGPLLILMTLNFKLMRALQLMRRRHRYMTSNSSHRQKENVTLTLVVVVSVFIVCELPDICLRIAVTLKELIQNIGVDTRIIPSDVQTVDTVLDKETIPFLVLPVTNMLLTVNSSVNFLIYCLIGKKFRRIRLDTCIASCTGNRSSQSGSPCSATASIPLCAAKTTNCSTTEV